MRVRLLKPGFFTNEDLASVSMAARLLFAGLWLVADKRGRLEDRPRKLRAEILPYDEVDADALLAELAERGFIERYAVDGVAYIAIAKFSKHQNPHPREVESEIPPPPGEVNNTAVTPPVVDTAVRGEAMPGNVQDMPSRADPVIDPDLDLVIDPGIGTESPSLARARGQNGPRLVDFDELVGIERIAHPTLTGSERAILDSLHEQVERLVYVGTNGPALGYCEDLIRRGATQSDVDFAIQAGLGKGEGYVRKVLERRVTERESGRDPDARARSRAPANAMPQSSAQRDALAAVAVVGALPDGTLVRRRDVERGALEDGRPVPKGMRA